MSHTPGPWILEGETRCGESRNRTVVTSVGSSVVHLEQIIGNREEPQFLANARLIAAAPELLEACHKICKAIAFASEFNLAKDLTDGYEACRAAIAKAEGGVK